MSVRIYKVRAMECMCTETGPRFTLSSERVLGEWSQNPLTPREKSPLPEKRCIKQNSEPSTLPTSCSSPTRAPIFMSIGVGWGGGGGGTGKEGFDHGPAPPEADAISLGHQSGVSTAGRAGTLSDLGW